MTKEEFKKLFDTYFDSVRSYLVYRGADKEQATDLAQDVFLRIWEKQLAIDSKGILGLLYKMAGNMFISRYRREMLELNYRNSIKFEEQGFSPEEQMQYNELQQKYTKALAQLDEKHRTVFLMARMEGLKYHEIAERLNLSIKAIEKRMSQTLAFLKKALEG
ncbi:MAG: sigma-70 family RNA polymerase sigma factor [Bacteroidales bacterium]|nr:sigma-70 family RNA polymerase sigma factor [Bacteroidales bacterium]